MSGNQTSQAPQPQTVAELNLHLVYLQRDVSKLVEAMPQMATKADIDSLARRLDGYATQDEVRSLRTDLEQVRQQIESGSVQSTVERWGNLAQRAAAIIAFVSGAVYFLHGFLERMK